MSTKREQIVFFEHIDELLSAFGERTEHIALAGELNTAQTADVSFLLVCADTLRAIFDAEAVRTGCRESKRLVRS